MNAVAVIGALGVILLGGLAGGRLAGLFHVPRVTGYLLAGLLIGPSFAHLTGLPEPIADATLADLRIVTDIALVLILLNIGGQFRTENLRRWKHRILLLSAGEIGLTFLLVSATVAIINLTVLQQTVGDLSLLRTSIYFALLMGLIATATAPAVTLMVIQEYGAEGTVTNSTLTLVGLNNIVAMLGFCAITHSLTAGGAGPAGILVQMAGPVLIGGLAGFLLSILAQRLDSAAEHKMLLLGGALATGGLCRWLGINPLLGSLVLGLVLSNSSPRWHQLQEALQQIAYPLYVAFFVIAGANLHLETLSQIGLLGFGYVAARTVGKMAGTRLGSHLGRFDTRECSCLSGQWPGGGQMIETIVLGSVIVFELIGPLFIRHGLVKAGEVPILSLLQKRAPLGTLEGLHNVVQHFRSSLGIPAGRLFRDPGDILVQHVMRRNVETILNSTPFNQLLHLIAHSRYDRFPVVDKDERFVGMIDYTEIRNLLFEPALANLVVASDLAHKPPVAFSPDQSLREALDLVQNYRYVSYFPVIAPGEPDRLLGILSQNDLIAAFRRQEKR
jgi:Kef-type K+ transport system membrane component KefB/CBS domain-containing protein